MGGKAAMVLALTRPELVRRLIVADIAPVAYGHTQAHLIAAMRRVDLSRVARRSDADAQLADEIEDPGVRAFLLQSLDVPGKCWRLNLDALEAEMPEILGWPSVDGRFEGPALFLHGGLVGLCAARAPRERSARFSRRPSSTPLRARATGFTPRSRARSRQPFARSSTDAERHAPRRVRDQIGVTRR